MFSLSNLGISGSISNKFCYSMEVWHHLFKATSYNEYMQRLPCKIADIIGSIQSFNNSVTSIFSAFTSYFTIQNP